MQPRGGPENRIELILTAVVEAAHRLLGERPWLAEIDEVLRILGEATGVSRVYVYENSQAADGSLLMTALCEWDAPGVGSRLADPASQNYPYDLGYTKFAELMAKGKTATGTFEDLSGDMRRDFDSENIKSLAMAPIFVEQKWLGFVGFDDCVRPRTWREVELGALRVAADAIGAGIRRELGSEQFRMAEDKYRSIIEKIPAVTYMDPVDENALSMYVSPQVQTILGCTPDQWLNDPAWWHDHIHADDEPRVWKTYVEHRESGEPLSQEYRMMRDDGKVVWVREEATLLYDDDGKPWAIQGLMHDTTEYHQVREQLQALSSEDGLTGLPNRAMFEEQLASAIEREQIRGRSIALLSIDIDDFKDVNDQCGHLVGDRLLVEVSTRIVRAAGDTALVARDEADRFLVMVTDLGSQKTDKPSSSPALADAQNTIDKIELLMRAPAALGGNVIRPTVSIGVFIYPENAEEPSDLIQGAEAAMRRAKSVKRAIGTGASNSPTENDPSGAARLP